MEEIYISSNTVPPISLRKRDFAETEKGEEKIKLGDEKEACASAPG